MPDTTLRSATISVLVDNEPGILARVIGLFSGRGYNIDSLTVAPVETRRRRSAASTSSPPAPTMVIEQIKAQLDRLVPVHRVADLTAEGPHVAREMALIKVVGTGEKRVEALRIAEAFRARVVDATTGELRLRNDRRDRQARRLHRPDARLGLAEVSRTGVAAMARGTRTISTLTPIAEKEPDHARLLRPRRRREPDQGQERRHHRLWQPGPRPCQQPEGQRREEPRRRPAAGFRRRRQGRSRRPEGHGPGRLREMGRRGDGADARTRARAICIARSSAPT